MRPSRLPGRLSVSVSVSVVGDGSGPGSGSGSQLTVVGPPRTTYAFTAADGSAGGCWTRSQMQLPSAPAGLPGNSVAQVVLRCSVGRGVARAGSLEATTDLGRGSTYRYPVRVAR